LTLEMKKMSVPLVVIAGPTAVGKSEIAVELALRLNGEIISADSVQVYKYFNIGTAKLSPEEQKGVPHHLLDLLDPDEQFSVADFQKLARQKIQEVHERGKLPLLVGGTGLYIQAVIDPYEFPEMKGQREIRETLRALWADGKDRELYQKLQELDPAAANRIHPNDFRRIARALEVYYLSGKPISSYSYQRDGDDAQNLYDLVMVGLTRHRSELYKRINKRVEKMFAEGLIQEVQSLLEKGYSPKLKPFEALGYKQAIKYLDGAYDLPTAIKETQKRTRNYAKRQLTWFRRDQRIHWFLLREEVNCRKVVETIVSHICRIIPVCVE
jgi:tRNA dimethylallyltransferase